jgi:hypothetical protein
MIKDCAAEELIGNADLRKDVYVVNQDGLEKMEDNTNAWNRLERGRPSAIAFVMSILLVGCSTSVLITSDPSGADVDINGQSYGQTPAEMTLSDFDLNVYHLTITKLGFRDKTATLQNELKAGPFLGGFVIWPFWLWCYGPQESYNFKLEPEVENARPAPESASPEIAGSSGSCDIENNIPETDRKNPDAVGVVIGISHYKSSDIPAVPYAVKGARLVEEYLERTFGVDERKIIFATDENASLSDFRKIFEEKLRNYVTPGKSDVYIYYQGHGVPDPETQEAYFVPFDCDPSYAKSTGYPLKEFYSKLAALPARSVTVILDACFSGASAGGVLVKNINPLYMRVKTPALTMKNGVVFTSSTDEQVSCWYPEKNESLFTYYFLKGLKGDADLNHDGRITCGEMRDYLEKNIEVEARYLNNREQKPQVMTDDPDKVLLRCK